MKCLIAALRRRTIGIVVVLMLTHLVVTPLAEAQQTAKVPSIGLLGFSSPTPDVMTIYEPFFQALQQHGYVVGENVAMAWR